MQKCNFYTASSLICAMQPLYCILSDLCRIVTSKLHPLWFWQKCNFFIYLILFELNRNISSIPYHLWYVQKCVIVCEYVGTLVISLPTFIHPSFLEAYGNKISSISTEMNVQEIVHIYFVILCYLIKLLFLQKMYFSFRFLSIPSF